MVRRRYDCSRLSGTHASPVSCTVMSGTLIRPVRSAYTGFALGERASLNGCTRRTRALISSGSVVLNGASVGAGAIVSAGAVVATNADVPPRAMALGVPARVREGYEVPEGAYTYAVTSYVERGRRFRAELRRLG